MYGGVLADRYAKRRVLMITQALMGVLALVLGHPGRHRRRRPVARVRAGRRPGRGLGHRRPGAAGVRLGDGRPGLLANAVSLNSTIFNGARLVGPSMAGLLIGAASGNTAPAFFVNAASFAFTIGALAGMRAAELRPSPPVARAAGQLRAGVAYTWAHPDLVLAMVLAFVIGTFGFNYQVTIALMARERVRPRRRGVRAALDLLRRRLADRRAAVHPAQRPAAAALPRRLGGRLRRCSPSSPG